MKAATDAEAYFVAKIGALESGLVDALIGMNAMMAWVDDAASREVRHELQAYIDRAQWLLGQGP